MPTKNQVEKAFRQHYRRLRDDTAAWNATLDQFAPFRAGDEKVREIRQKVSQYLRGTREEILFEEGDPLTVAIHDAMKSLRDDDVVKVTTKEYKKWTSDWTEEDFEMSAGPVLYIEFDDDGTLSGWAMDAPDYYRGHAGPTTAVFLPTDWDTIRGEVGETLAQAVEKRKPNRGVSRKPSQSARKLKNRLMR